MRADVDRQYFFSPLAALQVIRRLHEYDQAHGHGQGFKRLQGFLHEEEKVVAEHRREEKAAAPVLDDDSDECQLCQVTVSALARAQAGAAASDATVGGCDLIQDGRTKEACENLVSIYTEARVAKFMAEDVSQTCVFLGVCDSIAPVLAKHVDVGTPPVAHAEDAAQERLAASARARLHMTPAEQAAEDRAQKALDEKPAFTTRVVHSLGDSLLEESSSETPETVRAKPHHINVADEVEQFHRSVRQLNRKGIHYGRRLLDATLNTIADKACQTKPFKGAKSVAGAAQAADADVTAEQQVMLGTSSSMPSSSMTTTTTTTTASAPAMPEMPAGDPDAAQVSATTQQLDKMLESLKGAAQPLPSDTKVGGESIPSIDDIDEMLDGKSVAGDDAGISAMKKWDTMGGKDPFASSDSTSMPSLSSLSSMPSMPSMGHPGMPGGPPSLGGPAAMPSFSSGASAPSKVPTLADLQKLMAGLPSSGGAPSMANTFPSTTTLLQGKQRETSDAHAHDDPEMEAYARAQERQDAMAENDY